MMRAPLTFQSTRMPVKMSPPMLSQLQTTLYGGPCRGFNSKCHLSSPLYRMRGSIEAWSGTGHGRSGVVLTARYTTQSLKPTPLVYVVLPQPPAQTVTRVTGCSGWAAFAAEVE